MQKEKVWEKLKERLLAIIAVPLFQKNKPLPLPENFLSYLGFKRQEDNRKER